ncbi:MAG: class I SAM-dependent methyltransferase [Candidatus Aminicenantes bacterium]|nr:class I SAM-dependent methyltransferase [Candidatus Aminicenantes bacterium]
MKKRDYDRHKYFYDFLLKWNIPFVTHCMWRKIYDSDFFNDANERKILSSQKVGRIIASYYKFRTILDIGCGMGLYLRELNKMGKDVLGCDSSVEGIHMAAPEITVFYADVTKPLHVNKKFDTVLCFEVAEHIKKKYSRQLVKNCTAYSDTVLFTAAPEGQGGVGHINEQPLEFWINLFAEMDFKYDSDLSGKIRQYMKDEDVVEWIANNFMSFSKNAAK